MIRTTRPRPRLQLVPRPSRYFDRFPNLDAQQKHNAKFEERAAWLATLGLGPFDSARRLIRLVTRSAARTSDGGAPLLFGPAAADVRYPVIEERLVLPSQLVPGVNSTGNEADAGLGLWRRASPDDAPYPTRDE